MVWKSFEDFWIVNTCNLDSLIFFTTRRWIRLADNHAQHIVRDLQFVAARNRKSTRHTRLYRLEYTCSMYQLLLIERERNDPRKCAMQETMSNERNGGREYNMVRQQRSEQLRIHAKESEQKTDLREAGQTREQDRRVIGDRVARSKENTGDYV